MQYKLVIRGPVPAKKNTYKRVTRLGVPGLALSDKTTGALGPLLLQLQAAWKRPPLIHPDVRVVFHSSTDTIDTDGMWTTLCDLMQKSGVIKNDNIRYFNGRKIIEPAVVVSVGEEKVEIFLEPANVGQ